MEKSQAWSMDIMIAVVVFIGAVFIFYSVLSTRHGSSSEELQEEASVVLENIIVEDSDTGIVNGAEVNATKLAKLIGNYSDIKKILRIENEFCIFLEDDEGNLVEIKGGDPDDPSQDPDESHVGVGSGDVTISGEPCG